MIYKIEKDKSVFESNPGLELNPIFMECSDKELKYVFLLYDIDSPYAKMSFDERKKRAAISAGFKMNAAGTSFDRTAKLILDGKSKRVNNAIREFNDIQRKSNPHFNILTTISKQIDKTTEFLDKMPAKDMTPDEMMKRNRLATGLVELVDARKKIEKLLASTALEDEPDTTTTTEEAIMDYESMSTVERFNLEQDE